ncbi:MAG: glycosyltransferase family 2 protein [Cryomorphaceae bacterium]|nr:glycosyltransferase family 2 protein [Cryomorphaceae bacterium]
MSNPLVSIIVPNYNHAPFLKKRIDSVLNQTYRNTEIILLDDCSTDHSLDILKKIDDERVRLYPNRVNSGSPFTQWNKGVSLASGKYLWIAESDDFCALDFLEKLVPILESNDKITLAFCQSYLIDENDNIKNSFAENYRFLYQTNRWENDFIDSGKSECIDYLLKNNTIPNASAVLFRKEAYEKSGGAPGNFKLNGDWMLYAKVISQGKFAFLAEHLNYFRVHSNTQRHKARRASHAFPEMLEIQSFITKTFAVDPEKVRDAKRQVSEWWVGGLPHQGWLRKGFLRENIKLYREFAPMYAALWLRIIWHFTYAIGWYFLYITGLLTVAKKIRSALFPGKYFEH